MNKEGKIKRMRKTQLLKYVSGETGIVHEDVKDIFDKIFDKIRREVELGNQVEIPGFGIFTHRVRPPKRAYHLGGYARKEKAPKMIMLPEKKLPVFKPTKKFSIQV